MPIFFHMLLPRSCASKWYQWLRIWLSKNIRFVGVNVGMSARNRHFQTNYWCITMSSPQTPAGINVGMGSASERWLYIVMWSPIGWDHTQDDHCPMSLLWKQSWHHDNSQFSALLSLATHQHQSTWGHDWFSWCQLNSLCPVSTFGDIDLSQHWLK